MTAATPRSKQQLNCPPIGEFTKPMSMETLEFTIYPDGRVQEKVTGVVGQACTVVTAAIEAELGHVVSQTQTAEYFAQNLDLTAPATTQATW